MHNHMCSAISIQLSYFSMIQETNPGEALWAAGHRPTLARRNAALAQHLLRVCIREAQTPTGGVLWGLRLLQIPRLNKGHLKDCEACWGLRDLSLRCLNAGGPAHTPALM